MSWTTARARTAASRRTFEEGTPQAILARTPATTALKSSSESWPVSFRPGEVVWRCYREGVAETADPIFEVLAEAALARGFRPDEIMIGTHSPEGYVIRLENLSLYAEGMISPQLIEDGAGDPAGYFVDKLQVKMMDFSHA